MTEGQSLMDNLRLILWFTALALVWVLVQTWQQEFAPARPATPPVAQEPSPAAELPAPPAIPQIPGQPSIAAIAAAPAESRARPAGESQIVHVRTDVLNVEIDTRGGDLRSVQLPKYPVHKDQPDVPMQLLNPTPEDLYLFHTGLRASGGQPEADYLTPFRATQTEYALPDGASELAVTLSWDAPGQVAVEKTYRFRRGRYDIGLEYQVRNLGTTPYSAASYLQIQRRHHPPTSSYLRFNIDSYSFTGPVAYDPENKFQKLQVAKLADEPFHRKAADGWIASIQHHFLAAAIPPRDQEFNYDLTLDKDVYTLSAIGQPMVIAPGTEGSISEQLYVGPKLQDQLASVAPGLPLTVDYGKLKLLAEPLFWLLKQINRVVGNWGWSIIFATFLIKLAFYKLTETSGRSMARMRKLQPRLAALQERYKDDRQQLSQAMMEMYKREKVNPAAGCLPMLIQIPFFIAYYWVLIESVEMRQAPFALWITDLSSRDPYFILPLLNAGAMYLQTSLNPPPPDPMQAKMMKFMPLMFGGIFAFFPAGLILYYLTNSVLSILQQWRINKVVAGV